jgi:hypothetical protein
MKQIQEEIKDGFTAHEFIVISCFMEMEASSQLHEKRVAALELSIMEIDNSLTVWNPKAESSLTAIQLELTKLNSFNRDAHTASSPNPGVLPLESPTTRSSTGQPVDDPNGHCFDNSHRDCGFGRVFTQVHDPVTRTMHTPSPLPNSPFYFTLDQGVDSSRVPNSVSVDARVHMGKLPKMNFPKFDGDHPKLWQDRCETYFEMYSVEQSVWVRVASMHFEGSAAHWLQSVHRRIRIVTWTELCSRIHDRFCRDQHEALIR